MTVPTYVYECEKGHRFERVQGIKDPPLKRCPRCRARAHRVPSAGAGLIFKGSGFHVTDYRSKGYREKARQEGAAGAAPPGSAGAGKTKDPKPGAPRAES